MTYTVEEKTVSVPWDATPKLLALLTTGGSGALGDGDYDEDFTILDEYDKLFTRKAKIESRMKELSLIIHGKILSAGQMCVADRKGNRFTHREGYTRVTLDAKWAEKRLVELGEKSKEVEKHKKKTEIKGGLTFTPARPEKEKEEEE